MTAPVPTGPNAEQIQYWNETAGQKWVELKRLIDAQIGPLGRLVMDRARIAAGERVLDVGCGCADSTLEIAQRVGPRGVVTGIDVSAVMLERARQAARRAGIAQAYFTNADAQEYPFAAASFDVIYSRFGVMFFSDPQAAFANLRRLLRPRGRLSFLCWQALEENPWMSVPVGAALRHVSPPPPRPPGAPGPFAFADAPRVRDILERAGYSDAACEGVRSTLSIGGGVDLEQTVDFLLQMGPTGYALRQADPSLRPVVAEAVREVLLPFRTPQGVRMPSAAWIFTARA